MDPYNPAQWYWAVATNATQVWSSAQAAYVALTDATYAAWLARGNGPTPIPNVTELAGVLLAQYPAGSPAKPTQISPLDFIGRFTSAEQTAIATAAQTTPALSLWLGQCYAADYIDLSDPLTKQGLDALVAAGLLTSARELVILTP